MADITAKYLNKRLKTVSSKFGHHVGDYAKTRQQYSQILRPKGYKDGGLVMSYNEAKKRMQKAVNPDIKISFTKKDYERELKRFYEEQKEHLFVKSEQKIQRERAEDVIRDAYEYMGKDVPDLSKYSLEQLKSSIRNANTMYSNRINDSGDSAKFYERVIKTLMGNGDAET